MFNTPILFIIFNKCSQTLQVFNAIREIKPQKLYIAADGPRKNNSEDYEKCKKTREIINLIDWDCELHTRFPDKNHGCDESIPSAIDWFFKHNEMGIILEDDSLPSKSFFSFCEIMLNHYKNDSRIMNISGNNFLNNRIIGDGSYYFSRTPLICGFATWRRAWKLYNKTFSTLPKFIEQNQIANIFDDFIIQKARIYHFKKIYSKKGEAWDFAWSYSVYCQNGLCIVPNVNMITNIGFGLKESLHCHNANDRYANMKRYDINEIIHPAFMIPNKEADLYTLRNHSYYSITGIFKKLWKKISRS